MKEKKNEKVMKLAASYWFLYVPLLQYFVYYLCIFMCNIYSDASVFHVSATLRKELYLYLSELFMVPILMHYPPCGFCCMRDSVLYSDRPYRSLFALKTEVKGVDEMH